jgi:cell division protein FtsI (penicillin-binding protein 3)
VSRRRDQSDRPHPWRRGVVLGGWLICVAAVVARAGQIQVVQADAWSARAENQHRRTLKVPAPRGPVYDRNGEPLSVTRERVRVNVAPGEVRDVESLELLLVDALGLTPSRARQQVASDRKWNVLGTYPVAVRDRLQGVAGVHLDRVFQRYSPVRDLARGVLGVVIEEDGLGGVEQAFDRHLRGTPGSQVVARDFRGDPIPGEVVIVEAPEAGGEVVLTIDTDLQEIAQAGLLEAIDQHDARGGDVLITDPYSGEILALFSTRDGHNGALSAVNTPFEPGSTLKPFTVAGLLENGLATMNDIVDAENGRWEAPGGRTLTDTHTKGLMTLRDALRESSNIGVAKMAARLSPRQQYENLRDFGFGTLTGIDLPGEVSGTLRRPDRWTELSPASLAIGYEMSVTPLQMAMAYGALANGGLLMQPRLIREIRAPDGSTVAAFEPQVIRRVIDPGTAASVGRALEDVVTEGTGSLARLGTFRVAGKSGTARFSSNGGYVGGDYSSTFVGYFPADKPQLVVFVKLDRPSNGGYYGGAVAAPVTRTTMEAALAAAPQTLRLGPLATAQAAMSSARTLSPTAFAGTRPVPALPPLPGAWRGPDEPGTHDDAGDIQDDAGDIQDDDRSIRDSPAFVIVPDLSGLPARSAIRLLHRSGLRAAQVGPGDVDRTVPAAGARIAAGETIRLRYGGSSHE